MHPTIKRIPIKQGDPLYVSFYEDDLADTALRPIIPPLQTKGIGTSMRAVVGSGVATLAKGIKNIMTPAKSSARKKYVWLVARILMSVALLAFVFAKANIHTFTHLLLHMDFRFVCLALSVGVITYFLSAWQWQILLKYEGINLSIPMLTGLYFVGQTFNQLLPSSIGGDVVKAVYVGRLSGHGIGSASATLMARVIGLAGLFITSLPVAIISALFVHHLGWSLALILLAGTVGYVAALLALINSPLLFRFTGAHRITKYKIGRKVLELAETIALYSQQPKRFVAATLVSLIFYLASNLNFYCFALALHITAPFWFYWIAIPVTTLATLLPISLNGYGLRGASFVLVFGLMGVATASAFSLALAMEVQMLLYALVGGVILLVINRQLAQRPIHPTPVLSEASATAL